MFNSEHLSGTPSSLLYFICRQIGLECRLHQSQAVFLNERIVLIHTEEMQNFSNFCLHFVLYTDLFIQYIITVYILTVAAKMRRKDDQIIRSCR